MNLTDQFSIFKQISLKILGKNMNYYFAFIPSCIFVEYLEVFHFKKKETECIHSKLDEIGTVVGLYIYIYHIICNHETF